MQLSNRSSVAMVAISKIRRDGGTQIRDALNEDHVVALTELIRGGTAFLEPVKAFRDERGTYWLADGFHRVEAASRAEALTIATDVVDGSRREAVLFAAGANATHGLPRTNVDKRRAVEVLLRDAEWSKWSDREIARRVGVGYSLVAEMRTESSARIGQIESTRTVERNGTVYTQDTTHIGKAKSSVDAPANEPVSPAPVLTVDAVTQAAVASIRESCERFERHLAASLTLLDREIKPAIVPDLRRVRESITRHLAEPAAVTEKQECSVCPKAGVFSRGLCRTCYRKLRDAGLAMPAQKRNQKRARAKQQLRRVREWVGTLPVDRKAMLRRALEESTDA